MKFINLRWSLREKNESGVPAGFYAGKIIASHTCFGGHVDVNCSASLQTFKCVWWPEMDYKHTCDTIFTHFHGITNNIYGFQRLFVFCSFICLPVHHPSTIFLPIHNRFYPSKINDGWTGLYIKLCVPGNAGLEPRSMLQLVSGGVHHLVTLLELFIAATNNTQRQHQLSSLHQLPAPSDFSSGAICAHPTPQSHSGTRRVTLYNYIC